MTFVSDASRSLIIKTHVINCCCCSKSNFVWNVFLYVDTLFILFGVHVIVTTQPIVLILILCSSLYITNFMVNQC